jgi:RNA recognition motif-containing protein
MQIYIGNFPEDTTEQDLRTTFESFGQVQSVKVITDPISQRVLGFGFVEMPDATEGDRAVAALNLTKIKGRTVMVTRTKDRVERRSPVPQPI